MLSGFAGLTATHGSTSALTDNLSAGSKASHSANGLRAETGTSGPAEKSLSKCRDSSGPTAALHEGFLVAARRACHTARRRQRRSADANGDGISSLLSRDGLPPGGTAVSRARRPGARYDPADEDPTRR